MDIRVLTNRQTDRQTDTHLIIIKAICFSYQNPLEILEEFRCRLQTVGSKCTVDLLLKEKLENTECNNSKKTLEAKIHLR